MSFRNKARIGATNVDEAEVSFEVCKHAMHKLYKMGAEDAAKRELWDMMVIANEGDSYRQFGGAEVEYDASTGTLEVERQIDQAIKYIDCEVTVGDLGNK